MLCILSNFPRVFKDIFPYCTQFSPNVPIFPNLTLIPPTACNLFFPNCTLLSSHSCTTTNSCFIATGFHFHVYGFKTTNKYYILVGCKIYF